MLLLLASLALADKNVHTFVNDPQYTPPPFAGLERLYIDPATTAAQVKPAADRPAGERVVDAPGTGSMVFTNPMSQWGEVTLRGATEPGLKIGTIGPFATMKLDGFQAGFYTVDVWVTTGLTRHFVVEVK
jgi:hypothetical protein